MTDSHLPFLPYGRQSITQEDIKSVVDVLQSDLLTQGPCVPAFERAISNKCCAEYGVAVNSATSALHIACLALGLSSGDHLWTTPITFVASANCGRYCGADVDFVDVNPLTGLISITALQEKLKVAKQNNKLPKILVPVHLAGSSCDMKSIADLAEQYGFSVIEDASHAIGGQYKNHPVGSCEYSDICIFSFHPVKIITTGEGGLATTNNPDLAQRMTDLRSHGIVRERSRFERVSSGPWMYEQQKLGFNYRMTDIQAALGISQLGRLDAIVFERNRQFAYYKKLLVGLPVKLLHIPHEVHSSLHLAVVRLQNFTVEQHRLIFEGLRALEIGVQLHYSPVHLQPYYRALGFTDGQYPEAEAYATSAMSLPIFPGLSVADQDRVVSSLAVLLNQYSSTDCSE